MLRASSSSFAHLRAQPSSPVAHLRAQLSSPIAHLRPHSLVLQLPTYVLTA
jgi:hypothetical protein